MRFDSKQAGKPNRKESIMLDKAAISVASHCSAAACVAKSAGKKAAKSLFLKENGDVNVVSIVVLIGIAIILAIAFKGAITTVLQNIFKSITQNAQSASSQSVSIS
jgi:hypothetical protein